MPDHYHLIFGLGEGRTLSDAIAGVSKYTARRIHEHLGRQGALWEEGFHDHMLRDRKDFDEVLMYTHWNPVEGGLVEVPEACHIPRRTSALLARLIRNGWDTR